MKKKKYWWFYHSERFVCGFDSHSFSFYFSFYMRVKISFYYEREYRNSKRVVKFEDPSKWETNRERGWDESLNNEPVLNIVILRTINLHSLSFFAIFTSSIMEKEVAVMRYRRVSYHLKWWHISTKTEQLSGGNNNRIRLHILHFFHFLPCKINN